MPNPPKPTALKIMQGSARHDPQRVNKAEPKPTGPAKPPPWLPTKGTARDAWKRLSPILERMRVLTEADAEALALGCLALEEYVTARSDEASWRKADSAWKRYGSMLGWFGLTPSARTKVQATTVEEQDPLEQWVAR